jgi:hypothetical protein
MNEIKDFLKDIKKNDLASAKAKLSEILISKVESKQNSIKENINNER